MSKSLYSYTTDFLDIRNALEDADYDEELISDTLESYEDDIASKMENIIKYQNELLGLAELQKAEAKKFTEAATKKIKQAEQLMDYMDSTMKAIGASEIKAGAYSLTYKKGTTITEVDESKLPDEYFTSVTLRKPLGKPELKKLLDAGKEIEGVCLRKNPDKLQVKM